MKEHPQRLVQIAEPHSDILRPENFNLGQVPGDPVIARPSESQELRDTGLESLYSKCDL